MNAKRFKRLIWSKKVKLVVFDQIVDEDGIVHIYGKLLKSKQCLRK